MEKVKLTGLMAIIGIIVIMLFAGCINGNTEDNKPLKTGSVILKTIVESDSINGVYDVAGTTSNVGTSTANNAYVVVKFSDRYGQAAHTETIQLGDIKPSDEQEFSCKWAGNSGLSVTAQSYSD